MRALEYSTFRYYHIDPNDIESVPAEPVPMLGGGPSRCVGVGIDEPPCQVVLEDSFPGHEYHWTTYIARLDLITEGSCETTHTLPPAYDRTETVVVDAPGVYLSRAGRGSPRSPSERWPSATSRSTSRTRGSRSKRPPA